MQRPVIRYINNNNSDVVVGDNVVPAYDQIIVHEFIPALDALAGKSLVVLVDGVQLTSDLVPANIAEDVKPEVDEVEPEAKEVVKQETTVKKST